MRDARSGHEEVTAMKVLEHGASLGVCRATIAYSFVPLPCVGEEGGGRRADFPGTRALYLATDGAGEPLCDMWSWSDGKR